MMRPLRTVLTVLAYGALLQAGADAAFAQTPTPATIPGNVVWLDGSDPDGDSMPGGGFVNGTTWIDKSTAGLAHATQASATNRPSVVPSVLNGLSVVRLDGDDYMDLASSSFGMLEDVSGATLFAVARTSVTTGQRVFMVSTGAAAASTRAGLNLFDQFGTRIAGNGNFGAAGRRLDSDGFQRVEGGTVTLSQFAHWAASYDYAAGALSLFGNGALLTHATNFQTPGSTSPTSSVNIRIGADAHNTGRLRGVFTGDIAEIIVYDRVLTDAERRQVEDYLDEKWFGAAFAPFGQGCSSSVGIPELAAGVHGLPRAGRRFAVEARNLPSNAPVILVLGASDTTWGAINLPFPLDPLGAPGCDLLISLDIQIPLVTTNGVATWDLNLPASGVGTGFFLQAAVPAPGANAAGLVTSGGRRGRVGG